MVEDQFGFVEEISLAFCFRLVQVSFASLYLALTLIC